MNTTDAQIQADPFLTQMNQLLYKGLPGANATNRSDWADQVTQSRNTFQSLFNNLVGRAPTADETEKFTGQYITPNFSRLTDAASAEYQNPGSHITDFINQNFQGAAKDFATQQLQGQQSQAMSLADKYRSMGQQAISSTGDYLQNYAQQLFSRLQPQITTSMQAQGLLNTGGYNEAMAGAQKDLAGQAQGYLADANLQMNNQANQIAYSGMSAPYQYQQANAMNQVPYMQQMGSTALQNGYSTYLQNLNYQHQIGLQNNQGNIMEGMLPSFGRTLGQGFANSFGNGLGQWGSPSGAKQGAEMLG